MAIKERATQTTRAMELGLDTPRRVSAAARRRWLMYHLRGKDVVCPCCGHTFAHLADDWNRPNAICPRCGAHERHRLLRLWLEHRGGLSGRVLHFAPEWAIERWMRAQPNIDYVTSDLSARHADLRLDITNIALPDGSVDAVLASHVLEHIDDERSALRELRRILRPEGRAILLVPADLDMERTLEDPGIQSPKERERAYRQYDMSACMGATSLTALRRRVLRYKLTHTRSNSGQMPVRATDCSSKTRSTRGGEGEPAQAQGHPYARHRSRHGSQRAHPFERAGVG